MWVTDGDKRSSRYGTQQNRRVRCSCRQSCAAWRGVGSSSLQYQVCLTVQGGSKQRNMTLSLPTSFTASSDPKSNRVMLTWCSCLGMANQSSWVFCNIAVHCSTRTSHRDISSCPLILPCWFKSEVPSDRDHWTVQARQVPDSGPLPAGQAKL